MERKLDNADYAINGVNSVIVNLDGCVRTLLEELKKDPTNAALSNVIHELMGQRVLLANTNITLAESIPSVNQQTNVQIANQASQNLYREMGQVDELMGEITQSREESEAARMFK